MKRPKKTKKALTCLAAALLGAGCGGHITAGANFINPTDGPMGNSIGARLAVGARAKNGFGIEGELGYSTSNSNYVENGDLLTGARVTFPFAGNGQGAFVPYFSAGFYNMHTESNIDIPAPYDVHETRVTNRQYVGLGTDASIKAGKVVFDLGAEYLVPTDKTDSDEGTEPSTLFRFKAGVGYRF